MVATVEKLTCGMCGAPLSGGRDTLGNPFNRWEARGAEGSSALCAACYLRVEEERKLHNGLVEEEREALWHLGRLKPLIEAETDNFARDALISERNEWEHELHIARYFLRKNGW